MIGKNEKGKGHDVMERQKYKLAYFNVSYLFPIYILPTMIKTLTFTNTGIMLQSLVVTNVQFYLNILHTEVVISFSPVHAITALEIWNFQFNASFYMFRSFV
jgi:hypothetical protein